MSAENIEATLSDVGTIFGMNKRAEAAIAYFAEIRHAARVLTRPMEFTTDEYAKASALLKALAEEAT